MQLYGEGVAIGMSAQEICDWINEQLGLSLEESTYRKAYAEYEREQTKLAAKSQEAHEARLLVLTKRDLRQRQEQKKLTRLRALVEQQTKVDADRNIVVEAIKEAWNSTVDVEPNKVTVACDSESDIITGYAFGDIHWGYTIDDKEKGLYYNTGVAAGRITAVFDFITKDVIANGYNEVYIFDLADDIEGAALRNSQLLRIVTSMTEQASEVSRVLIDKLTQLSIDLPDVKLHFVHVGEDNHSQLRLHNTSRDELPENLQRLITARLETFVEAAQLGGLLKNLTYYHSAEVILNFGDINLLAAHGHQYSKNEDILIKASARHQKDIHMSLFAHWHQYSHKYKEVYRGIQKSLVFIPPIVGGTDYSDRLFLSSKPGFVKLELNLNTKTLVTKPVLFNEDIERGS